MNVYKSDAGFLYLHRGEGRRIWVNPRFVKKDDDGNEFIEFPVVNARLKRKKTGTLVLVPEIRTITHQLYFECGYRGSSTITFDEEPIEKESYYVYHSPRGSLGISEGVFFTYPNDGKERVIKMHRYTKKEVNNV